LSAADAGRPRRFGGACGLEGANYGNKSPPLAQSRRLSAPWIAL